MITLCFVGSIGTVWAQQAVVAAPDSLPSVTLPPDMDRVLRDYERAWQAKDTEALVSLFVTEGFVMQPQRPPIRGHAGLRQAYRGAGGPLYLRPLAFAQAGSVGYIIGAYRHRSVGNDTGKFILTLRNEDGKRWLIAADMDNSIK